MENEEKQKKKWLPSSTWLMVGLIFSLFVNGILGIANYIQYEKTLELDSSYQDVIVENEEQLMLNQERMDELTQDVLMLHEDVYALNEQLKATVPVVQTGKIAYLTFDDGPSSLTPKVLDVLKQYKVSATFFVLGNNVKKFPEIVNRVVLEGHALGNHSNTHRYDRIYVSLESLRAEIAACNEQVRLATGIDMTMFRFPGGSSNTMFQLYGKEIPLGSWLQAVHGQGMEYYDWNVSSLDASSKNITSEMIVNAVVNGAGNKKEITVLMHDITKNQATLDALPQIIERLREKGYSFEVITSNSLPVQHKIAS